MHALYASCAHLKLWGDTTGRGQNAFYSVAFSLQSQDSTPDCSQSVWMALQAGYCMQIVCWLVLYIGL